MLSWRWLCAAGPSIPIRFADDEGKHRRNAQAAAPPIRHDRLAETLPALPYSALRGVVVDPHGDDPYNGVITQVVRSMG
jgi:hypothetical protein